MFSATLVRRDPNCMRSWATGTASVLITPDFSGFMTESLDCLLPSSLPCRRARACWCSVSSLTGRTRCMHDPLPRAAHALADRPMLRAFSSYLAMQGAKAKIRIRIRAVVVLFLQAFSDAWHCVLAPRSVRLANDMSIWNCLCYAASDSSPEDRIYSSLSMRRILRSHLRSSMRAPMRKHKKSDAPIEPTTRPMMNPVSIGSISFRGKLLAKYGAIGGNRTRDGRCLGGSRSFQLSYNRMRGRAFAHPRTIRAARVNVTNNIVYGVSSLA